MGKRCTLLNLQRQRELWPPSTELDCKYRSMLTWFLVVYWLLLSNPALVFSKTLVKPSCTRCQQHELRLSSESLEVARLTALTVLHALKSCYVTRAPLSQLLCACLLLRNHSSFVSNAQWRDYWRHRKEKGCTILRVSPVLADQGCHLRFPSLSRNWDPWVMLRDSFLNALQRDGNWYLH